MEATCSSETSVDFWQTTRGYIPEARKNSSFPNLPCFGIHREPLRMRVELYMCVCVCVCGVWLHIAAQGRIGFDVVLWKL
jgi:hypothetical protein